VRTTVRGLGARVLALFAAASLAATAAAAPANVYDKFRNETYSNKGLMSEQDEARVGAQVHGEVQRRYRFVHDPQISGYVERVGERIARASVRPNLNYHFFVVEDDSLNAFSIPGGFVYVNTGILALAQTEDELAAVLAHETAHIAARHGLRNIKRAQRAQLGVGIASILGQILTGGGIAGRAASTGAQLIGAGVLTKHSRDFEREADYLGLYNLERAGYDTAGMIRIFQRLGQQSGRAKSSMGGIFASHPNSGERVRNTETEIEQHLGARASARRPRPRDAYSGSDFVEMKQALAGYRSGGRGYARGRDQNRPRVPPRGTYDDDPYEEPARDERPRLKRRPVEP
jgi:predicted Zn-dependent protease